MEIRNISVIGAGLMGSGIAQVMAESGFEITILLLGPDNLEILQRGIQKAVDRRTLTDDQATLLLSHIKCTSLLKDAVKSADLVIEVVIEDLAVKRKIFREIDAYSPQNAIIATNTSSLSISSIAAVTKRPEKVVGMHFFNPASAMKLVEVVQSPLTSEETISSIIAVSQKIGKFPLVVKDSPGFVVNRILMSAINAAAFVLREKVASAETIDSAMKLGANHPMGPLALADFIGIDVCLNIMKELDARLENSKFQVCPLFEHMVAKGNLGRKTGKGFFVYETKKNNTS